MHNSKSPGNDGFLKGILHFYFGEIGLYLVNVLNFSFYHSELTSSQKQAVITLIQRTSGTADQSKIGDHFNDLFKKTNECVSLRVPTKKITKNGLKLRSKPWVNTRIQKFDALYRDKLFTNINRNSASSNRYLYKKFRNRVVAEQRKSEIDYFQKYFETNKTNMKMLWSGI